jgi:hypothetical protein
MSGKVSIPADIRRTIVSCLAEALAAAWKREQGDRGLRHERCAKEFDGPIPPGRPIWDVDVLKEQAELVAAMTPPTPRPQLRLADLKKRFTWADDAQATRAANLGLPKGVIRAEVNALFGGEETNRYQAWSAEEIDRWEQHAASFSACASSEALKKRGVAGGACPRPDPLSGVLNAPPLFRRSHWFGLGRHEAPRAYIFSTAYLAAESISVNSLRSMTSSFCDSVTSMRSDLNTRERQIIPPFSQITRVSFTGWILTKRGRLRPKTFLKLHNTMPEGVPAQIFVSAEIVESGFDASANRPCRNAARKARRASALARWSDDHALAE